VGNFLKLFEGVVSQQFDTGGVPDLVSTIEQYVEKHNRDPKPFIWTAKASDILAKVTRARKKLNKMQTV
jgi:hypothetical protein